MTKNLLFAALLVAAGVSVTSCGNDRELEEQTTGQTTAKGKAHVRLVCGMDVGMDQQPMARHAPMRATLKANDRELADLYIMDYDKATRSASPTLLDAASAPWNVAANVLTPIDASQPVMLTADKTSDTLGAQKDVSVGVGQSQTMIIQSLFLTARMMTARCRRC